MDQLLLVSMGTIFILLGVLTGAFFCFRIVQAGSSKQWPWVVGELQSAALKDVLYEGREVGGGADLASARVVDFRYRYRVNGQQYDNKRVTFSDAVNKTSGSLNKLQQAYQGKSQIKVYYHPAKPELSVLVPGLSLFNFTPLITSLLFILAGVFMMTHDFS